MNIAIIGLGRMGSGMGQRLVRHGHSVAGFDLDLNKRSIIESTGIAWLPSIEQIADLVPSPRVVIIMVPAGAAVDSAIESLLPALQQGDVMIDGGNSFYKDSIARAKAANDAGIAYLDAGVSGGVWGLEEGYCIMVGGDKGAYERVEPVFADLAAEGGQLWVGQSGAGHYAKMVHNGIEYAMLQAYGEGFEILEKSAYDFDLAGIAGLWNSGSVVRSWLLELAERALDKYGNGLESVRGWVADSGEGRWTVQEAIEENVPAPTIALSLMMRFRSRQDESYSAKLIAALRNQFGGHEVRSE